MSQQRTLFEGIGRDNRKRKAASRRKSTNSEKYRPRGSEAYRRKIDANRRWRIAQGEAWKERCRRIERNRVKKRNRSPEQAAAHAKKMRELKQYRRENGLCTYCGDPATPGKRLCDGCREKQNAKNAKIKAEGGERYKNRLAYARKKARERKYKRHGMTRESYKVMLAAQGGGCAICGRVHSGHKGRRTGYISTMITKRESSGESCVQGAIHPSGYVKTTRKHCERPPTT